tara:strand:+ start:11571 stop:12926 length:1356 start_codon:yes stop_codon:yes gene_type:complete
MSTKKRLLSKTVKKIKVKDILPQLHKIKLTIKKKVSKKKNNSRKRQKKRKKITSKKDVSINKYIKDNQKDYQENNQESNQEITIIKSVTSYKERKLGKEIYDTNKKNPKLKKLKIIDENIENNFPIQSLKSFSPKVNQNLVSLKSILPSNVFKCSNLLETNINNKCLEYTSKLVQNKLLKNLRSSKHLDSSKFIAPKQYNSNCWFNTLFVSFFFSDKGRKFFRFMRQLMITGKKINGEIIPDDLAKVFFIFNKIIEASYNQDGNNNYKLIENYNTNYFIENIYDILLKKNIVTYKKNQSGNPLEYYLAIVKYLNYDAVNILTLDIYNNNDLNNINKKLSSNFLPEIIIIEIIDEDSKKINNKLNKLELFVEGTSHKYKLDAAIIRDTSKQHFCSLLTCNGNGYSFDGASYSRLSKYDWLININKNTNWGFQGHNLKWNFMLGYQMLFYYKI